MLKCAFVKVFVVCFHFQKYLFYLFMPFCVLFLPVPFLPVPFFPVPLLPYFFTGTFYLSLFLPPTKYSGPYTLHVS